VVLPLYVGGRKSPFPITLAILAYTTACKVVLSLLRINVKNFHGSLTTVVKAQNDTSKTANITDTIFDRTHGIALTSDGVLKIGEIRRSVSCYSVIECKPLPTPKFETKVIWIRIRIFGLMDVRRISVPKLWIHSSASFISPSLV